MGWDFVHYGIGRWLHIFFGVLWVGLLYYFNLVHGAAMKAAAAEAPAAAAAINRYVTPRALFVFRWAAVGTWFMGAFVLGDRFGDAFLLSGAYVPIGIGAWLGTIMLFNVWALIWPNQKKALGIVPASDAEKEAARRTAFLASRTNVALSLPLLFFMVASGGMFRPVMFP